jgi:hypothetical protein
VPGTKAKATMLLDGDRQQRSLSSVPSVNLMDREGASLNSTVPTAAPRAFDNQRRKNLHSANEIPTPFHPIYIFVNSDRATSRYVNINETVDSSPFNSSIDVDGSTESTN